MHFLSRGRILGRNLDKSLSSLLLTVTSTTLPWDFYFFKLTQPLTASSVYLLNTIKEKGGKPDRTLSLWFKKSIQKPQVWELSRLCPETFTKLFVHEFGFCSIHLCRENWLLQVIGFTSETGCCKDDPENRQGTVAILTSWRQIVEHFRD